MPQRAFLVWQREPDQQTHARKHTYLSPPEKVLSWAWNCLQSIFQTTQRGMLPQEHEREPHHVVLHCGSTQAIDIQNNCFCDSLPSWTFYWTWVKRHSPAIGHQLLFLFNTQSRCASIAAVCMSWIAWSDVYILPGYSLLILLPKLRTLTAHQSLLPSRFCLAELFSCSKPPPKPNFNHNYLGIMLKGNLYHVYWKVFVALVYNNLSFSFLLSWMPLD